MASKTQKKKKATSSAKVKKVVPSKKPSAKKSTVSKKTTVTKKPSSKKLTTAKAKVVKKPLVKKKPTAIKKIAPKKKATVSKATKPVSKQKSSLVKQVKGVSARSSNKKEVVVSKTQKREVMKKESKTPRVVVPKGRKATLQKILLGKRDAISQAIKEKLGQSLTDEQQRRLESAMDTGDQALVDLDREMGISLQEMRNKERQQIEDALVSLEEGTYGICAECEEEVSEKRLQALPFARLCVACQTNRELMEKIQRSEQRS
ncbi:MAG: TraR/DksA family transcriptional regulator [Nitrospirales bacterium]